MQTFAYSKPASVADAARAAAGADAKIIAGGQSLLPSMRLGLAAPEALVDLAGLDDLKGISVNGGTVKIGAMTTHAEVAASADVMTSIPALADLAGRIGARQVRNRGTIGGSLCWNYIAACMPPTVLALGAGLELVKNGGSRTLSAEEFLGSPLETARADGEILRSIKLPAAAARAGSAYKKWGLVTDALPVIGVCVYLQLDAGGGCSSARFAVGGLASGPRRSTAAENALNGAKAGDQDAIAAAAAAAAGEIDTQDDHWADSAYRKQLIRALGAEVIATALARAG
jgi:carbon-monoxide dehydrogenase medium subunit